MALARPPVQGAGARPCSWPWSASLGEGARAHGVLRPSIGSRPPPTEQIAAARRAAGRPVATADGLNRRRLPWCARRQASARDA